MGLREDICCSLDCIECENSRSVGVEDIESMLMGAIKDGWAHTIYGSVCPSCKKKFKKSEIEDEV